MRVCIVTSMYPTKRAPHNGVFITRRIEALQDLGCDVKAYALVREETKLVELIRRVVGKQTKEKIDSIISTDHSVYYQSVYVRLGLFGALLNSISHEGYFAWKAGKALKSIVGENYDVIHAHWLYPTGKAAIALGSKFAIPVMITCHGSDINREMRSKSRKGCISTLAEASSIEFVSQKLMKTAEELGGRWKCAYVLPNGISSIPERLHEKGKNRVGFVGNLIHVKRVDCFPALFRRIQDKVPDAEFIIVGDGERMKWLKSELSEMPVRFIGRVSQQEVIREMLCMDVMVLPSRNEGWPCVVLEAHSCGTPVVGSNAGGIPEAIGDPAFIVKDLGNESEFIESFAQKVTDVMNGVLKFDQDELRKRASEYLWINLQRKEIDNYHRVTNN